MRDLAGLGYVKFPSSGDISLLGESLFLVLFPRRLLTVNVAEVYLAALSAYLVGLFAAVVA